MIKAKDAKIIYHPSDIILISGMRAVKYCVSHCSAGPRSQKLQAILDYWQFNNGWKNSGYHFIIAEDGTIYQLLSINRISNGVAGYNSDSINICCIGGVDAKGNPIDNRSKAQIESHIMLLTRIKELFNNLIFLGHRDFSTDKNGNGILESWEWIKACPGYDFRTWLKSIDFDKVLIPAKIIYKLNYPLIKNTVVGDIQIALRNFGFYTGKIDDIFGEKTSDAVELFQRHKRLPANGIVNAQTAYDLKVNINL